MRRDPRLFLHEMHAACENLLKFLSEKTFEQYVEDVILRSAVERQFEILGEALNYLRSLRPELAAAIPEHRKIIKFRNVLIHGYFAIKHEVVWSTVQNDIPPLLLHLREQISGWKSDD